MSRYLVTVTALADVRTYVVVEADDPVEAKEKAVQEARRDDVAWVNGAQIPCLLDATRVELIPPAASRSQNGLGAKTYCTAVPSAS